MATSVKGYILPIVSDKLPLFFLTDIALHDSVNRKTHLSYRAFPPLDIAHNRSNLIRILTFQIATFFSKTLTPNLRDYLDMLLPEGWDSMTLYERRNFINGSEFEGSHKVGVNRRTRVCNMEIFYVSIPLFFRIPHRQWQLP